MYANIMTFDEKISFLYTIDLLLIVKLIEEHTDKQINNSLYILSDVYRENMTYEDYWELLEFFIDESEIGSFISYNDFCEIQLNSFSKVQESIEQFPVEQKEEIFKFFSLWENMLCKSSPYYGRRYSVNDNVIEISFEAEDMFSWYKVCKKLIELDSFCKKIIKEHL